MKRSAKRTSAAQTQRRYRDRRRRDGLRQLQIWVPDTGAPGFAKEFRRQAELVAARETDQSLASLLDEQDRTGWTS